MKDYNDFIEGLQEKKKDLNIKVEECEINKLLEEGITKLKKIEKELNDKFIEREDVIKDCMRALVIGQHMFLYGPPGTGKSLLISNLCKRIKASKYFQWLLNKTSDPSEILGPYSIKAIEKDRFLRKTQGKLPEANIVFLDEIWKSNEPTLNILLPILNEKIFYNDSKIIEVPLISMFCASNEIPDDDSLNALYDRIIFREHLDYIKDTDNKIKMLKNYVKGRRDEEASLETKISLEEIYTIQNKVKDVEISDHIYLDFIKLMEGLKREGIIISDRRKNECLKVLQGAAILEERNYVVVEDFEALTNVLWTELEDVAIIETQITKVINPYDDKVNDYMRKFNEIKEEIDSIQNKDEKIRSTIEGKVSIENILKKLDFLIKEAESKRKNTDSMIEKKNYIKDYNKKIMKEVLGIDFNHEF
ncbi:AAA family ATPase [Clostridium oceanicum]|uniref:AAA family ATPase n=1 Tax=Clostridium oceanicum TaxID=1543 RepID=A0ABN1JWX2_9CLOT